MSTTGEKLHNPVVAIVGPTAAGKSDLAIRVALDLHGEIVNADAMQFYRGMDIGTAKMPLEERAGIAHHELDVLNVDEDADVAGYQQRVRKAFADIDARGKRIILVGGSGLYIRAAVDRIDFPGTDPNVRARWEEKLEHVGSQALHDELARLDPQAAEAILPTNGRRIVRALEVIELTGGPFIARMPEHVYEIPTIQIGIRIPIDVLDQRIEDRVHQMWESGLLDEVRTLMDSGILDGRTARGAVGYHEAIDYLRGDIDKTEAIERTVRATRRLARKQMKWFAQDPRITWLDGLSPELTSLALNAVNSL